MQKAQSSKLEGNQAFQEGRYAAAVSSFSVGIYHNPTDHVLYSNRSAARCCLFMYEDALADAVKCIELSPNWAKGYSRKGVALAFLGRNDDALEAYKAGLQVDPNNSTLKENLALLQAKMSAQASKRSRKNVRWSDPIVTPLTTPSATPTGSLRGSKAPDEGLKSLSHVTFQSPDEAVSYQPPPSPTMGVKSALRPPSPLLGASTTSTPINDGNHLPPARTNDSPTPTITTTATTTSPSLSEPSPTKNNHSIVPPLPIVTKHTPPLPADVANGNSTTKPESSAAHVNNPTTRRAGAPKPAQQQPQPPAVTKEGWLFKKGGGKGKKRNFAKGGRRNWNHRWFVYDGEARVLMYYRSPEEAKTAEPLGVLDTEAAYIDDVHPEETHHQLHLCCALRFHDRDFLIAAETQEFINHWRATLCGWKYQMYQNIKNCHCLRAGFLLKKGGGKGKSRNFAKGGRRNWKVRWFQMESAIKLCYYDCPTSNGTHAKKLGELYLCQGVVDDVLPWETHRLPELCIALRYPHRDLLVSSMNLEDMQSWRYALNWWRTQQVGDYDYKAPSSTHDGSSQGPLLYKPPSSPAANNGAPSPASHLSGVLLRDLLTANVGYAHKLDGELAADQACRQLTQWRAPCVPVVDASDTFLGVFTASDVGLIEATVGPTSESLLSSQLASVIGSSSTPSMLAELGRSATACAVLDSDPYDGVVQMVTSSDQQGVVVLGANSKPLLSISTADLLNLGTPAHATT